MSLDTGTHHRKPVVYAKARSTPTALAYVAAGEWWHVHHEAIQRLIDHGWVEDNVPGTGPDRYRITPAGLDELARYQPWNTTPRRTG